MGGREVVEEITLVAEFVLDEGGVRVEVDNPMFFRVS